MSYKKLSHLKKKKLKNQNNSYMIPNASRLKNSKPKLKISLSYKENITQQPKRSFCAWLAIRDKLGTRDRLSRWDRSIPLSCMLCGGNYESRDHLFLSCPFGWEIWSRILFVMSSSHRIGYWGVELSWICNQGIGKIVRKKLSRLLWCATIYFIWQERNHRLHGGAVREPMVVFQLIRSCIKARAASWNDGVHGLI